jgi:hypothetical protein
VPSAAQVTVSYDSLTGKFWLCDGKSFYTYDYASKTFTGLYLSENGFAGYPLGVIDPVRRKYFVLDVSVGQMWVMDMTGADAYAPHLVTLGGDTTIFGSYYPGMVYSPVTADIVAWNGGDTVYRLDTQTNNVTAVTGFAGGPGPAQLQGTYGRWQYVPMLGVFAVVNDFGQNAFTFRLTRP